MYATRIYLTALIALPLFSLGGYVQAQHGPGAAIFYDDFGDGDATNASPVTWTPYDCCSGDYSASSGDYVFTPTGAPNDMFAAVFDVVVDDVSARTQVRLSDAADGTIGMSIRATPTNPSAPPLDYGSYFGGVNAGGLVLFRNNSDPASPEEDFTFLQGFPLPGIDVTKEDVILQMDTNGNTISLSAWAAVGGVQPDQPQITITDDFHTAGNVCIVSLRGDSGTTIGTFRYVSIVPEPATFGVLGLGLLGVLGMSRRKN